MQGDREATLQVEAELGAPTAADDPAEGDQGDEDQDDQRAEAGPSEATAPHRARGAGTRWRAPVGWACRRMGCNRSTSQGCSASGRGARLGVGRPNLRTPRVEGAGLDQV